MDGIESGDFEKLSRCVEAHAQTYLKGDWILLMGDAVRNVGLILSGSVKIMKESPDGNTAILTELGSAALFGEVFACAGIRQSPVSVQAAQDCEVLWLNFQKIVVTCASACDFHSRLIRNMLRIIAQKNLLLNQKIDILSKRTTREKLLMFFDTQRGASRKFTVPYNREEMARALCVDRSAMSGELCRMRDEGLIRFHKNEFELL